MFWDVIVLCRLSNYLGIEHVEHLVCRWPEVKVEVVGQVVLLLDAQGEDYVVSDR